MSVDYSALRKQLTAEQEVPEWYSTGGLQLFYEKYSYRKETPKRRWKTVAKTMAKHAPKEYPSWWNVDTYTAGKTWEDVFFNVLWDGLVIPSTPMFANAGLRKRGTTVSCAGGYVGNNLFDRYNAITEAAVLTKHGHGTSYSVDDWPCEGAKLARGGHSKGVIPLIRDFVNCMSEVTQGSRRGSLAYSLDIEHGDALKALNLLYKDPEGNNLGWLIKDGFVEKLQQEDEGAMQRLADTLSVKMPKGKGYYTFIDKMNRHLAEAFKRKGLTVKASNLCQETCLPADENYTFSCVILNYNLELYDRWPEHLVFIGQVMSDCNISEYLECMEAMSEYDKKAMSKIYRFTKEFRALGSGVLGLHTLFQKRRIVVGDMESIFLNQEIFSKLDRDSKEATEWLAEVMGEPEGCLGLGIRNATRLMMPPTKSTSELAASCSEGIGLDTAMVYTKQTAGGEIFKINKVLLALMKERGVYNPDTVERIARAKGSIQKEGWLTEHEKAVFRTAFEIDMKWVIILAASRQKYIDQQQSINLYFTSNDSEEYIAQIHRMAFLNENILSLYYIYSMRGAGDVTRITDCESCQ
jgi:ribonucleoside-diphosphate reductase alpha chain